jgi:indolepyruvate ferredoxin oxidoreductase beta subunit
MGGEGGGVLADWLVDLAERAGYLAQTTSVPGVAQRTGATIYYLEFFPEVQTDGRSPVLALMPVPGEVDIVVASELMEAARAIQRGLVTSDRTTLIASTHRVYSMTEKTAIGDGRVDDEKLVAGCREAARLFIGDDFAQVASEAGSVISAALFGAIAGANVLPFRREQFEDAIRQAEVGVSSSLMAFAAGFRAATEGAVAAPQTRQPTPGPRLRNLASRLENEFPRASHAILMAGIQRLCDYQDEPYAVEYLDLLESIRRVDKEYGDGGFQLLNETGRYLALWMSYEDASRVADLKIRRTRFERVKGDLRVGENDLVQINEFLYPRIEEIADVLPERLGRWLLNAGWARRLVERVTQHGRIVQTTSLRGFLQLYLTAELRRRRRGSLRYRQERSGINNWLSQVAALAANDYELAMEVAECPRLLKGYGDTRVRGQRNYELVMDAIPKLLGKEDSASSLKKLREAALADETGEKLAAAMRQIAE